MKLPLEFYDYSDAQLDAVLCHLLANSQILANDMADARPDISHALDAIVDHITDSNIDFSDVLLNSDVGMLQGIRITLDRKAGKFIFFGTYTKQLVAETKAFGEEGTKKTLAKLLRIPCV